MIKNIKIKVICTTKVFTAATATKERESASEKACHCSDFLKCEKYIYFFVSRKTSRLSIKFFQS